MIYTTIALTLLVTLSSAQSQTTSAPASTVSGPPPANDGGNNDEPKPPQPRDCSAFNIDGFLLDCSTEFGLNEEEFAEVQRSIGVIEDRLDDVDNKIKDLEKADQDMIVKADEIDGRLKGRLDGVDGDIGQLRQADVTLDTKLNDADKRLSDRIADGEVAADELKNRVAKIEGTLNGYAAARGDNTNVDDGNATALSTEAKDLLIVCLLIFNIGTILGCISCLFWSKQQRVKGHVYGGVIDYDAEVQK